MLHVRSRRQLLCLAFVALSGWLAAAPVIAGNPHKQSNSPPTITGTPPVRAVAGTVYAFVPAASDPDGDALRFRAKGKPSWAAFDSSTGQLTGTPSLGDVGTSSKVTIQVTDGVSTVSLPTFTLTVDWDAKVGNRPPAISGSPATSVVAGSSYVFQPSASDPDADPLTFSISGKPAWAAFNASTGALSGTPTVSSAGTYSGIAISVSDGKTTVSLAPFAVVVAAAPDRPPVITGPPVTVGTASMPYAFKPTASDPDGDTLQFSISGKPSWATFDAATGTLYGTPSSVGTYSSIQISVSDGTLAASLAPFSISVAAAPTKSVTLNWTAPTQNSDGSALSDLAGYLVSYGTASHQYQSTLTVPGGATSSISIEGLAPGTWYFAVRSYNVVGTDSDYSGEVSVVL
jgi:hypothetical protein